MSRNCKYGDVYEGLEGEVFLALIRRAPADIPFGFDVLPWYIRTLTRELKFQLKMQGLDETTTFDDFHLVSECHRQPTPQTDAEDKPDQVIADVFVQCGF